MLAHGAAADMRHRFLEDLSRLLAERGIATFRYNFPYTEKGRGGPNSQAVLTATVRTAAETAAAEVGELPLFAGGKSMGGRMTSLAASEAPLPGVKGLIFFGFPLHPPGKRENSRAAHLAKVNTPMLFIQGPRDNLATPELLAPIIERLGKRATLHTVEGADHSFNVPRSSGRTAEEVLAGIADSAAVWMRGLL
jgi:hypothetical protein